MIAFPLSILALAAGVLLLTKVKKDGLGMLYKALSWLVVLLALAFMLYLGRMAWRHHHTMDGRGGWGHGMEHRMMMNGHCNMNMGDGKDSAGGMAGCHMQGDSIVMDRDVAEKAMGKEACDKMCKERGRCIMSKDECMKMCHTDGGGQGCMGGGGGCMMGSGGGCCMGMSRGCCGGGGNGNSCCGGGNMNMGSCGMAGGDTKSCCKK